MKYTIKLLTYIWAKFYSQLTVEPTELQEAIKETYKYFQKYKNESLVPRDMCELIDNINYFATMEKATSIFPGKDYSVEIYLIVETLISVFLNNPDYCEYPLLKIKASKDESFTFDLEKDNIIDFCEVLKKEKNKSDSSNSIATLLSLN